MLHEINEQLGVQRLSGECWEEKWLVNNFRVAVLEEMWSIDTLEL